MTDKKVTMDDVAKPVEDAETIVEIEKGKPLFTLSLIEMDDGQVAMKADWGGEPPRRDQDSVTPIQLIGLKILGEVAPIVQQVGEIIEMQKTLNTASDVTAPRDIKDIEAEFESIVNSDGKTLN